MHTPSPFPPARSPGGILVRLILVAACILPVSAAAQAKFPGAPEDPSVNVRLYPLDTWSPRVGPGLGAGLVVHHVGRRNAQALLTAAPARREQVATAAWASANPQRARQYVLMSARALHTNRDWFYGLGPNSSLDARQSIERSAVQVRARGGHHFLDRRLLVHPHLGVSVHRIDHIPSPSAPDLDARSRTHLQQLTSERVGPLNPQHTGLRVGIDVQYDTRPPGPQSTRGVLLKGGWYRYVDLTSSFVRFNRFDLGVTGRLPLGNGHRLVGRFSLAHTIAQGQAPVPYYLRPMLGGSNVPGWSRHRFVDSDRIIGNLLYRFPLAQPLNVVQLEGHLGLHAASVYDDVFSDAAFDLTMEESPTANASSVPLRPAASLGMHVGLLFRKAPSLDLAVGLSPEGLTAVRFTFNQNLQALRPPHHQLRRR